MTENDAPAALRGLQAGATLDEALALYDSLPPVRVEEMIGSWRGAGLPTGTPMDGLLEVYGWQGKRFDSPDEAHPLVFGGRRGLFSTNPAGLPLGAMVRASPLLRLGPVAALGRAAIALRRTRSPKARLRMIEYRGVPTATMSYDALPINDHFRRVDERTLLGVMDLRGLQNPFFFLLLREEDGR
ncbi:DUF4334 domain-containing protein [Nocardiopsis tropica]